MCGAPKQAREATEEEKTIASAHKADVEAKLGKEFSQFDVINVTTQVVSGTNYQFAIETGSDNRVYAKVYVPLPCNGGGSELSDCRLEHAEFVL